MGITQFFTAGHPATTKCFNRNEHTGLMLLAREIGRHLRRRRDHLRKTGATFAARQRWPDRKHRWPLDLSPRGGAGAVLSGSADLRPRNSSFNLLMTDSCSFTCRLRLLVVVLTCQTGLRGRVKLVVQDPTVVVVALATGSQG